MAGYIMLLGKNNFDALKKCFETGIYSTNMNITVEDKNGKLKQKERWGVPDEGTFADYLSMKAGDNIYFFIERKIYGIGKIINIGDDCKYLNFENADNYETGKGKTYEELDALLDDTYSKQNRCFCAFEPDPYFFESGIDMDDVLSSNPDKFKMLRVIWKVSFIKVDDEENKALRDIILKRNEQNLVDKKNIYNYDNSEIKRISKRINKNKDKYKFGSKTILSCCADKDRIRHEMAIEAALCELLSTEGHEIFGGKWDYISHQVAASPFKPIDYMDKIDIFGYRYIEGYDTVSKYIIVEIKKDNSKPEAIGQIMKYVDWVTLEYAHGDYSMIEAYVVAKDFPEDVLEEKEKVANRSYVKVRRPVMTCIWDNLKLVKYKYKKGKLDFELVE